MSDDSTSTGGGPEMSFLGHLEELRNRIVKSIVAILAGSAVAAYFREEIMNDVLLRPAIMQQLTLQNLEPFGTAMLYLKVIFTGGLIVAFPFVVWQVWGFVAPGLYRHEQQWARRITLFTTICFLLGVAFAYFLLIPSMMAYIKTVANPNIENNIATNYYFSFFVNMILASGLIFELPMVTWILSRMGIVSPQLMSKYRRHSIIIILILAAIITPSPDPVSQMMVAAPLYILFEISVVIARLTFKPRI
jgi:sec-independent protein translocase protein TatC